MKKLALTVASALMLALTPAAMAAEGGHIEDIPFSFEGPFGSFDKDQLQRGLQVYTEVCAACHGLKYLAFRSLEDLGYSEAQVRTYAAQYTVVDHDSGEERPAIPADHFPANTAAGAPDLSLMAKARAGFHGPYGLGINQLVKGIGGPEYIHAMLTGFSGETREVAGSTFYENHAFPGGWMAMPNTALEAGAVTYADGSPNDLDHMSRDVSAFLTWAAEPKMMQRKHAGFLAVTFLALLSVLLYLTNKRLWKPHKDKLKA